MKCRKPAKNSQLGFVIVLIHAAHDGLHRYKSSSVQSPPAAMHRTIWVVFQLLLLLSKLLIIFLK